VTLLLTFFVSAASALVPLINIEAYLLAAAVTVNDAWWLLALAAAAGQTLGKLLLFLAARGAIRGAWLTGRLHHKGVSDGRAARWMRKVRTHRSGPVAVLATSAVLGLPPLLATSVVAGTTTMRPALFGAVCLFGRWARFCLLLAAPALVLG
jgi:membrane protein YqaA with SNARE-associated domain